MTGALTADLEMRSEAGFGKHGGSITTDQHWFMGDEMVVIVQIEEMRCPWNTAFINGNLAVILAYILKIIKLKGSNSFGKEGRHPDLGLNLRIIKLYAPTIKAPEIPTAEVK